MDLLLDLDEELIARLERKAKIDGLSLEEQLKKIITNSVDGDGSLPANENSAPRAN